MTADVKTKPDVALSALDIAVLEKLSTCCDEMTYVIRNTLDSWPSSKWRGLKCSQVLTSCRRLERAGYVEPARTSYIVQKCWRITRQGRDALAKAEGRS